MKEFSLRPKIIAEGSSRGLISWKFDLSSTNLAILLVSVSCPGNNVKLNKLVSVTGLLYLSLINALRFDLRGWANSMENL